MHAVAGAGPEIAGLVEAESVEQADGTGGENLAAGQLAVRGHGEFADVARAVLEVRRAGVGDVELLVVGREAQPVRLEGLVGDLGDRARLRVDPVDRLLLERADARPALRQAMSFILHQRAIAGVGEPDRAVVGVHHRVVRGVELLAVDLLGEHGRLAVVLVAHDLAGAMLAGDLAALVVERVPVAVPRRVPVRRHAPVFFNPAHLHVVRDVAPHQVLAIAVPRRPFGP